MNTQKLKKTIYGDYALNPVGYCKFHKRVITTKQLKEKGCVTRTCWYLVKYMEHDFWKQYNERIN